VDKFLEGLAEILEIPAADVTPALDLTTQAWDSLAVVSAIALIDEHYGVTVDGAALAKCGTVKEVQELVAAKVGR
jgi:acyl carrier protein